MRFAVIAAGEGSRLVKEGIDSPKPLVEVNGEKLVDRLLRVFSLVGATEIVVICNEQMDDVRLHLESVGQSMSLPFHLLVKSTPSSMHSLWELRRWLADAPFVLTTVDTIFREQEFGDYVRAFELLLNQGGADGLMGVTDYIDDERPLYVETDTDLRITAFLDRCDEPHYISGGIYGLVPRCFDTLRHCVENGESRMRNFQRALLADGLRLKAWPFTKVLDVDHVADISKAAKFLSGAR